MKKPTKPKRVRMPGKRWWASRTELRYETVEVSLYRNGPDSSEEKAVRVCGEEWLKSILAELNEWRSGKRKVEDKR